MKDFALKYIEAVIQMVNMEWFQFLFIATVCYFGFLFIKYTLWGCS